MGRYDEAIQAYDKATQIDHNYALAWYDRGCALDNMGKYDEAIQALGQAIEIDPHYAKLGMTRVIPFIV